MEILLVAWRYLVARPITLVAVLAVTIGLTTVVVVDSVMNGFLGAQRNAVRALLPDVTVDVGDEPAARVDALLAAVRGSGGVARASRRVEVPCLHRPDRPMLIDLGTIQVGENYFVEIVGIDPGPRDSPDRDAVDLAPFLDHAQCRYQKEQGSFFGDRRCPLRVERLDDPFWFKLDDAFWRGVVPDDYRNIVDLEPVIVGERLARECDYRIGGVMTISTLAQQKNAAGRHGLRSHRFVVVGTFSSRDDAYDSTHLLVPREAAVQLGALAGPAEELAVTAMPGVLAEVLRAELRARLEPLGVASDRVVAWSDKKSLLLNAVESERRVMNVAMFFVVVVATFSMLMTLNQMVRMKMRDLGVLSAMGGTPARAGQLFLLCGFLVTTCGSIAGLAAGLALTHWLNAILNVVERATGLRLFDPNIFDFNELPTEVDAGRIAWYVVGTLLCGTLFTLVPSLRAARLDPVEALRHE